MAQSPCAKPWSERRTTSTLCHCRLVFFEHPSVLAAAALGTVYDERAFAQRYAGQPTRHDDNLFAVEDVRPQVDATAFEARRAAVAFDVAGALAELDDRLSDEP